MIKSGYLRHKVLVQLQSLNQDPRGERVKLYTNVFSMRCNIQVLSGTELIKAGVSINNEYLSILARYDARLLHKHFLSWKDEIYSVGSIKPSDDLREMVISASRQI